MGGFAIDHKHFFFDNNFLSVLCKDPHGQKIQKWNESLKSHGIVREQRLAKFLATPFVMLESIGINVKSLTIPKIDIPDNLLKSGQVEELKHYLYDKAYQRYSEHPELQANKIKDRVGVQKRHFTEFGADFFEEVVGYNSQTENFQKSIYQTLAFDYLQKFNYPGELHNEALASFTVDILRGPGHGWNLSQARLIYGRWSQIGPGLLARNEITQDEFDRVNREEYCYRPSSDLVDTEITHFSTVGWYENGQLHPVVCFTCDPSVKTKFRAALYRFLVQDALVKAKEIEKRNESVIPFKLFEPRHGMICICCRNTGEITDVIDVGETDEIII